MTPHFGKTHGWAAVVFDEAGLSVTTVRPAGNEVSVVLETTEPHAAPLEGQTVTARYQATAETLKRRVDLGEYQIVTAVGGDDVFCQTLRLPTTDSGELKQMLDLQIDSLTPLPVEEIAYSFEPLETTASETRVLLAVARKAVINERVAALEAVGWPPACVHVDVLATFAELLRREVLPADDRLNTLVLISSAAANFIVFSTGKIVTIRSVLLGDPALIRAELTRTLVAAEVERPGAVIGQTIFATGSESLHPLVAELAAGAEILPASAMSQPVRDIALDSARTGTGQLNLLPDEWREQRRKKQVRHLVVRSLIGLGAVYVVALLIFLTLVGIKRAQISGVERELGKQQVPFTTAQELRKTLSAMQQRLDRERSALEALREVSQLMPDNVKLTAFTFKRDANVLLRGQAQAAGFANDFISKLEKSDMFTKVTPGGQRIEPGSGLTKFDVDCSLKTAGVAHANK